MEVKLECRYDITHLPAEDIGQLDVLLQEATSGRYGRDGFQHNEIVKPAQKHVWPIFLSFCEEHFKNNDGTFRYRLGAMVGRHRNFTQFRDEYAAIKQRISDQSQAEIELARLRGLHTEVVAENARLQGVASRGQELLESNATLTRTCDVLQGKVADMAAVNVSLTTRLTVTESDNERLKGENADLKSNEHAKNRLWGLGGIIVGAILTIVGTKISDRLYPNQPQNYGDSNTQRDRNGNYGNDIPTAHLPLQVLDSLAVTHNANVGKKTDTIIKSDKKKSP
jgi:hypothetical protein